MYNVIIYPIFEFNLKVLIVDLGQMKYLKSSKLDKYLYKIAVRKFSISLKIYRYISILYRW